ncbi:MAG: DegV family protein [Tindallia sp. MSAO_Bac2]|nr:MAG: DegV family protein [Tindallia sp. MSAO_Bac2]
MATVHIMTDSTSDLPKNELMKRGISVVPLYVHFDQEVYRDGVDIDPAMIYSKVDQTGIFPKTSSPSPKDFIDAFKPIIDKGHHILYIGLSSQISSTIQNARIAASEFPDHMVEVIDSLNLSAGIGMLVLEASDLALKGESLESITEKIHEMVPKIKTYFAVDTLQYLHKGGRCSSMENLVGNMLRIRPILHVENGKIIVQKKIRGKREKLVEDMMKFTDSEPSTVKTSRLIVNHSACPEDAEKLRQHLLNTLSPDEVLMTEAGCVISSHCGPKTFSVVYRIK